jgi:polysaccharide pyruvyl transferase WcaK-like protein
MRILIQPSDYRFLNAGDGAMMSVAMRRLLSLFTDASFDVLTDDPDLLPAYSERVRPVSNLGRWRWSTESPWQNPRIATLRSLSRSSNVKLGSLYPRTTAGLMRWQFRKDDEGHRNVSDFLSLVGNADAFVVTGMGGLTSAFSDYSEVLLDTIELCVSRSIPTILLGQGLGPFEPRLLSRAAQVLPQADFIALREGLHGPRLLQSWGANPEMWTVTGDDALELGAIPPVEVPGSALGVNLRVSDYSGVTRDQSEAVRLPIVAFAKRRGIAVRVIPISRVPHESDGEAVSELLRGRVLIDCSVAQIETAERVIRYIQGCRVVLTGSYHAGVFALGQGIPVIGLAKSPYYEWKFQGLAHQFPDGCEAVRFSGPDFGARIETLLDRFWDAAPSLGPALRSEAQKQVNASRAAYHRAANIICQGGRT